MWKLISFFCIIFLVSCCQAGTVNSTTGDGYDTIFVETPSILSEVHWVNISGEVLYYVFGQGQFKEIKHGSTFQSLDVPRTYDVPFISNALFANGSNLIAVGPTYYGSNLAPTTGFSLPLSVSAPTIYTSISEPYRGYSLYSVSVDYRSLSDIIVYFVGWVPNRVANTSISLAVVRAHLNINPISSTSISWNETTDVLRLQNDNFFPYTETFKPHIYHDYTENKLFVLDPVTHNLFEILVPATTTQPLVLGRTLAINDGGRLTGVAWSYVHKKLYAGFAAAGIHAGTLVVVNYTAMSLSKSVPFPDWYSNPQAIVEDEANQILYIAFPEAPNILKYDEIQNQIVGYQRLPFFLRNVYKGFDARYEHVYFITREQHSKVFRVLKSDFCPATCPLYGYCTKGTCVCSKPYSMSASKECVILPLDEKKLTVDRSAAIAMGVLFAITTIAAVAGWFLWYKRRGSSYVPV